MYSGIRRVLSILAAFGVAIGLVAYVASIYGASMERTHPWPVVMNVWLMTLILFMVVAERSSLSGGGYLWLNCSQGWPKWVMPTIQLLSVLWVAHLILFVFQSHGAAPTIKDGAYVLDKHGDTIRRLTLAEYRWLKGAELRLFAAFWLTGFFTVMLYWWFPRVQSPS